MAYTGWNRLPDPFDAACRKKRSKVLMYYIQSIDIRTASEKEFLATARFSNRMRAEKLPNDPTIPEQEYIVSWQNIPSMLDVYAFIVWNEERTDLIAKGNIVIRRVDDNQHISEIELDILPEYRRQGLGKKLLFMLAEVAKRENRNLLIVQTVERIPGGEIFMNRIGAQKAMESHVNQLILSEVDRDLLRQWKELGHRSTTDFALGFWEGPYPEEQIVAITELYKVMNQQPHGNLDVENLMYTPEILREQEKALLAEGAVRWTYYAYERESGAFAGFTDVVWRSSRPDILYQENTGVWPQYRNKGLGRWLKAAMLEKVFVDRPQVQFVRTQNADSNAPMLKINHELGFKPYNSLTYWQMETKRVLDYTGR